MAIFLVRHGHAGDRSSWHGDDRLRPLSDRGHAQAAAIARRLAPEPLTQLLSSPALRCLQTFGPLSKAVGLDLDSDWRLHEGSSAEAAFEVIETRDQLALCSHGDVIPDLLDLLRERGVSMNGRGCKKGSIWRLETDGKSIRKAFYEGVTS